MILNCFGKSNLNLLQIDFIFLYCKYQTFWPNMVEFSLADSGTTNARSYQYLDFQLGAVHNFAVF